jgi:FkbM family methyltransferase
MNKNLISDLLETKECRYGLISYFKTDKVIGSSLSEYGEWAQNEIDFLMNFIKSGDTIIDVGSFIGTHALAFATQVGPFGCVYAFEPNPLSYMVLKQNIIQNGYSNIIYNNVALSNKVGSLIFEDTNVDLHNPGSSSLLYVDEISSEINSPHSSFVQTSCLDQYAITNCRLIKIDVEGMEDKVLEGAHNLLSSIRPLVYTECLTVENGAKVISFIIF